MEKSDLGTVYIDFFSGLAINNLMELAVDNWELRKLFQGIYKWIICVATPFSKTFEKSKDIIPVMYLL